MTHKSIDALLASTMFLMFTLVTPHYEDVAKKIGFIDIANAQTTTATTTFTVVSLNKDSCTPNTYPWIKVISPTDSDTFAPGDKVNVKWQSCNTKDNRRYINLGVRQVNFGDGTGYNFGGESLDNSGIGSFDYLLPEATEFIGDGAYPYGKNYKIMVASDQNDNAHDTTAGFSIEAPYAPSVIVITPNGGETLIKGQTYRIKWETKDTNGLFVYLIKDGVFYDSNSLNSVPNTIGYMDWTVPTTVPDGSNYKIEISQGKGDPDQAIDQSDVSFKIASPVVTNSCVEWRTTSGGPQGGTYWEKLRDFGKHPEIDQYRIQWFNGSWSPWYTPTVGDKDTKINNDGSWRYLIAYKQDHNWETRDCLDNQTANPTITLLTPNGGENFPVGGKMAVYWKTSSDIPATNDVLLQFLKTGKDGDPDFFVMKLGVNDGNEIVYIPKTTNDGVTPVVGGLYYVRILTNSPDGQVVLFDSSDQQVGIKAEAKSAHCDSTTAPWIKVLSPNGNEVYMIGDMLNIKWESCNYPHSTVDIVLEDSTLEKQGFPVGTNSVFIVENVSSQNNSYQWKVPATFGTGKLISLGNGRVYRINLGDGVNYQTNVAVWDKGDDLFTINNSTAKTAEKNTKTYGIISASQSDSGSSGQDTAFTRRLVIGKKGDDVMLLQEILIDQGFLNINNPTGYYGPITNRSVKKLQQANKIQTTGVVGPLTRALLNSIVEKMNTGGND